MTRSGTGRWPLYAFGWSCALMTVALLVWPQTPASSPAPQAEPAFKGRPHDLLTIAPSTRSPLRFADDAAPEPSPASTSGAPTLVGVIAGRAAYLRGADSGTVERVGLNETFEGWQLTRVASNGVTVTKDRQTCELRLYQAPDSAPAPTASPAEAPVQPLPMKASPPTPSVPAATQP